VINFYFVAWDNKIRHAEINKRVEAVLENIQGKFGQVLMIDSTPQRTYHNFFFAETIDKSDWHPGNYPHLCSPFSPCITLQWTYRDGNIVNLPWALLVKGDFVVIRPGQAAPGFCFPMEVRQVPTLFFLYLILYLLQYISVNNLFAG